MERRLIPGDQCSGLLTDCLLLPSRYSGPVLVKSGAIFSAWRVENSPCAPTVILPVPAGHAHRIRAAFWEKPSPFFAGSFIWFPKEFSGLMLKLEICSLIGWLPRRSTVIILKRSRCPDLNSSLWGSPGELEPKAISKCFRRPLNIRLLCCYWLSTCTHLTTKASYVNYVPALSTTLLSRYPIYHSPL